MAEEMLHEILFLIDVIIFSYCFTAAKQISYCNTKVTLNDWFELWLLLLYTSIFLRPKKWLFVSSNSADNKKSALTIFFSVFFFKELLTSTTPSCSGPIPAQKSLGNSVLGVVFSHTMPKMDFRYSHRFSWEKIH